MSRASTCSNRTASVEYFKQKFGVDDQHAQLLHRAERLQEKGQLDQALVYFEQVLQAYPGCNEARQNVEMINRFLQRQSSAASQPEPAIALPRSAKISSYGEGIGGMHISYGFELDRTEDGRSSYTTVCDEGGESAPLKFPKAQSDEMWAKLMEALDDGSGLSTRDPTNGGEDMYMQGEKLTISLDGSKEVSYYTSGHSPVERIINGYVKAREKELAQRYR